MMGSLFNHVRSLFGAEEDTEELRVHYGDVIIPLRVSCDSTDTIRHLPDLLEQLIDVVLPPRYDLAIGGEIVSDKWARMISLRALIENEAEVRILTAGCDGGTKAKSSSPPSRFPAKISASTSLVAVTGPKRPVGSLGVLPEGKSDSMHLNQKRRKGKQSMARQDPKASGPRNWTAPVAFQPKPPPSQTTTVTSENVSLSMPCQCSRSVFSSFARLLLTVSLENGSLNEPRNVVDCDTLVSSPSHTSLAYLLCQSNPRKISMKLPRRLVPRSLPWKNFWIRVLLLLRTKPRPRRSRP
jgi:hypothetical protein